MSEISWTTSQDEDTLIHKIVDRAERLGIVNDRMESIMDITAVHCNGCSLRLSDMEAGADFDFVHDFTGIARNINRKTGQLNNHFLPRFAA